jgi:exodeoxyribonuclease V beta subunit
MKSLDINKIELQGMSLIEASAGTGKTFTITSLYLLLLMEKNLSVKEILVVTYTVAATSELKSRIRNRLIECLSVLKSEKEFDSADEAIGIIIEKLRGK